MSSWDEWLETGAGKQRVQISMPDEPVFAAAGLYDANVDLEPVRIFVCEA